MKPLKVGEKAAVTVQKFVTVMETFTAIEVSPPIDSEINLRLADKTAEHVVYVTGDNWKDRVSSIVILERMEQDVGDKWPLYKEVVGDTSSSCCSDQEDQ